MEELRLIWKHKGFIIIVTLIAMLIAGTVNFRKYNKYFVYGEIGFEKHDKKTLSDRDRFESIFFEGLELKHRLEIEEHDFRDKTGLVFVKIKTGDPEEVTKRLDKIGSRQTGIETHRQYDLSDKVFYTLPFSLCLLVMASVFALVFFDEKKKKER